MVIVKECRNSKADLISFFVDFRKSFETVPQDKLSKRLDEIMVPRELRIVVIFLYEIVVSKVKNNKWWSKDIKSNIGPKKGYPLSPNIFGIYIDNLEECLEIARYKGTDLAGIIIKFLLYDDDIIFLARIHAKLDKQLRNLNDYCSNMGMTINTYKTKVMIIKSKNINHGNFVYNNNFLG